MILMCEPLETVKCKKCGKIVAEPKELIRIKKKPFIGVVVGEEKNEG
jgi:hypothetical protein